MVYVYQGSLMGEIEREIRERYNPQTVKNYLEHYQRLTKELPSANLKESLEMVTDNCKTYLETLLKYEHRRRKIITEGGRDEAEAIAAQDNIRRKSHNGLLTYLISYTKTLRREVDPVQRRGLYPFPSLEIPPEKYSRLIEVKGDFNQCLDERILFGNAGACLALGLKK